MGSRTTENGEAGKTPNAGTGRTRAARGADRRGVAAPHRQNHGPVRDRLIVAGFLVFLMAYAWLYFAARPERWQSLASILLPDEIMRGWCGGEFCGFDLTGRGRVLAVAATIWLLAWLYGRASLGALAVANHLTRLERFVFSVGIGLSELSLLTLAVGLLGWLHQPLAWATALALPVGLAVGCWWQARARCAIRPATSTGVPGCGTCSRGPGADPRQTPQDSVLLALGLPFVLLIVLGGMLPPLDFDVREYHLQVPKEWYAAGQIGFLPHNVYGNMPLGAEMHALLAILLMPGERGWWWGALAGKTVIASFAILAALLVLAAGRRLAGPRAGTAAALACISTPWLVRVSANGLIDGALAFYLLLAAYAMWLAKRDVGAGKTSPGDGPLRVWRWLLLAGFAAGSAAACKYPGLLYGVLPITAWAAVGGRRGGRLDWNWRAAAVVVLGITAGCGLWLGKNWVLAGNPVYPLLFGGQTRTPEKNEQWRRAHQVPADGAGHRYAFSQAADAAAMAGWASEGHSPLLVPWLALLPLAGAVRRSAAPLAWLAAFVLLSWWLFTHRIERFLVPLVPLVALLGGVGITWSPTPPWRLVLTATVALGLTANFLLVTARPGHDCRYLVSLERLRRDEPRAPGGPSRVDFFHRYLNDSVPPTGRVLLVGDAQAFDLEVPVRYNTCFDDCVFEQLVRGKDRAARNAAFREQGITHVYIAWNEIARYRSPGNYGFTDFVTKTLVHDELGAQQGLLRKVAVPDAPDYGEVFEVSPDAREQSGERPLRTYR